MADPRFYDNRGPFALAEICARAGVIVPKGANGTDSIADLAGLEGAGPDHLTFCTGAGDPAFAVSRAGWCFVARDMEMARSATPQLIVCDSVQHAFAAADLRGVTDEAVGRK